MIGTQLSSPVITCPITSDSSSILFNHSQQISIWWSPYSLVGKWQNQQEVILYIFNFSHRIILTGDCKIFRSWGSCRTGMWQSSRTTTDTVFAISSVQMLNGHPIWGSNAVVSLPSRRPYANWRSSNLQAVPRQCTLPAWISQSPLQISLTDNKTLSHLVHFSHSFSEVQIWPPLQISLTDKKILSHLVHFSHSFSEVQIC